MGACLCRDGQEPGLGPDLSFTDPGLGPQDTTSLASESSLSLMMPGEAGTKCSKDTVNSLVLDTLLEIRTLVENEQEPPASLLRLHTIADKEEGWVQLVESLVTVIPLSDPLGPAVMTLLLDDCPLPTVETARRCLDLVGRLSGADLAEAEEAVTRQRNLSIVLGCIAEKLAGPRSVKLLTEATLDYLISSLDPDRPAPVILFSLIALEKFSQTSENKVTIAKRLEGYRDGNPLEILESRFLESRDFVSRQVGFCSQWCLDNMFPVPGRKFTYTVIDNTQINMMLNSNDVSEYLKIGPNGLGARCDASSFESVRCTYSVSSGAWYYEVLLVTCGVMQIGWATKDSKFLNHEGYGIGDDDCSQAYDGCRQLMWFNADCESQDSVPQWQAGDIVGCFIDIDNKFLVFSLNGQKLQSFNQVFQSTTSSGFFPAASFMSFQQCEFNFGWRPYKYPPESDFKSFNDVCELSDEERKILPRPMKLEAMKRLSVKENACTICFDNIANIQLLPCQHGGFCDECSKMLDNCPMCRSPIETIRNVSVGFSSDFDNLPQQQQHFSSNTSSQQHENNKEPRTSSNPLLHQVVHTSSTS